MANLWQDRGALKWQTAHLLWFRRPRGSADPHGHQPPGDQRARHRGIAPLLDRDPRLQAGRRIAAARRQDALLQRRPQRPDEPPRHSALREPGPTGAARGLGHVQDAGCGQPHRDLDAQPRGVAQAARLSAQQGGQVSSPSQSRHDPQPLHQRPERLRRRGPVRAVARGLGQRHPGRPRLCRAAADRRRRSFCRRHGLPDLRRSQGADGNLTWRDTALCPSLFIAASRPDLGPIAVVVAPEESPHALGLRREREAVGFSLLDYDPAVHEDDAVDDVAGEARLVGDDNHRRAVARELPHRRRDLAGAARRASSIPVVIPANWAWLASSSSSVVAKLVRLRSAWRNVGCRVWTHGCCGSLARSPNTKRPRDQALNSAVDRFAGWRRLWFAGLAAIVIGSALLGSLSPVSGDDPFFLLNDARWLVEHHEIPSVDHFSYTAQGQPWIYPVGGSLLFYGLWLIGGYALLSWFSASATAATTALLLRNGSVISAVLTALAIPLIAVRTGVRADLFTTLLSAAYLALLWRYHKTGRARLWLLPVLMILWVNAHLGFFLGLGVDRRIHISGRLGIFWPDRRRAAAERLWRAGPWFVVTAAATVVNPFSDS